MKAFDGKIKFLLTCGDIVCDEKTGKLLLASLATRKIKKVHKKLLKSVSEFLMNELQLVINLNLLHGKIPAYTRDCKSFERVCDKRIGMCRKIK